MENGFVRINKEKSIAEITFFHPKSNSLPSDLLRELKEIFENLSSDKSVNTVILKSEGDKAFCAGASFDELLEIENYDQGKEFFMGFARLINAMRKCEKIIIGRIHGKIVGGGVGLVSACDYSFASAQASLKLSELAIGLGPFVVGPPIERRIGKDAFIEMSLDCQWRSADWAKQHGLYHEVLETFEELDISVKNFAEELTSRNPEALRRLKNVFWEGTDHWDKLLEKRAEYSGELVLSEHTKEFIKNFRAKLKN